MSMLQPRNRLVNFRLSEDEFERLKASCKSQGARSISDFARSSVLDRMEAPPNGPFGQGRLTQIDTKVSELEMRLGLLLQTLQPNLEMAQPALTALFEPVSNARGAAIGD
jgi:hypothetical protein